MLTTIKTLAIAIITASLIFLRPNITLAQNNPLKGDCINTAIGCIPVKGSSQDTIQFILRWALGVGGGIAFLLIVLSGFQIMTSQGNPERLKAGQELLTSAIMGLLMIIFSVFILRFIGIDLLALPGLN